MRVGSAAPSPREPGFRSPRPDLSAARELALACGVGPALGQVLLQRGLGDPGAARAYLDPRLESLTSPADMADREAAADRLARACRKGERVAVFGDYDVDGSTSAAILADVLEALGADVVAYVANRFQGGYGFSEPALRKCLAASPGLIVTCDCGSSDHERIAMARAAGVDVIVVDHHLVPDQPLPALAFLNPHRPDCGFAFKGMCSAGLALSVGAAVRQALGAKLDLRAWLDLVALGTVADVAPLEGDNRALTRAGLRLLASPNVRPGIAALRENARLRPGMPLGAHEIAFRLAPRLNAAGRLGDPTVTLDLLRARSAPRARLLAAKIEQLNEQRKAIERRITEEACAQVEVVYGQRPAHGVVVAQEGWHRGVVGITAARLVDRFHVPAVVIAMEDGVGHGSGRTPDGFHLHRALSDCRRLLLKFGGHAAAAGLTVEAPRLDALRAAFADVAPRDDAAAPTPEVDVTLGGPMPLPAADELRRLEPLGEGNPAPRFALPDAEILDARSVMDGQHLKLRVRFEERVLSAFGRDMAHLLDEGIDEKGSRVTLLGALRPDGWRGGDAIEMDVAHVLAD